RRRAGAARPRRHRAHRPGRAELPLPRPRRARLQRGARSGPVPAHRRRGAPVRGAAPRPAPRRRPGRRRAPGLADGHRGHRAHRRPGVPAARRRLARRGQLRGRAAPVHGGPRHQLEDARAAAPAEARAATERLYARLRADRIDVPVFRTGGTPDAAGEPWLYAVDADTAPDRVPADPVRLAGGAASRPRTPGIVASSAAGAADPWGGATSGGKGYGEVRRIRDAAYQRRTTLTHLAGGITVHNARTAFGGTSWGWLPGTNVYTSYDHGAAVDEARRVSPKLAPMQQLGHL